MLIFLHDFFNVVVWAKWYTTKLWLSHFRCAKGYFESLQLFFSLFLDTLIDGPVSVFSVAKSTSALMTLLRVYKIWLLQSTRTSLPWRLLFYTFRSSSNHKSEGGKISQDAANHSTVIVDILKESLTNTTKEFNEVLTTRAKVRFMSSIAYFSPLFHSFMQLRHSRIYTIICRSWGSIKTEEIFSHCQLQGTDQILPSSRVNHLSP